MQTQRSPLSPATRMALALAITTLTIGEGSLMPSPAGNVVELVGDQVIVNRQPVLVGVGVVVRAGRHVDEDRVRLSS